MKHYQDEVNAFQAKEKDFKLKGSLNIDEVEKKEIAKKECEWFTAEFMKLKTAKSSDYKKYVDRIDEHWGNETSIHAHIDLLPYFAADIGTISFQQFTARR